MRFLVLRCFGPVFLLIISTTLFSQVVSTEYEVKAVFIDKFAQFVKWPESSLPNNEFVITVIGSNLFRRKLEKVYAQQDISGKRVKIININNIKEIGNTHVLFIGNSESNNLIQILNYCDSKPILTISDNEGFGMQGVMINFYLDQGKIRFEINEHSIRKSKLQVKYQLLNSAKIIYTDQ